MIRAFERVAEKFRLLSSLVKIVTADDAGPIQVLRVEGLVGELREGVSRFGEFGFASNPPAGATGVALALGGNREDLVVIATEDRDSRRKNLPEGAAVVYAAAPGATELALDPLGIATLRAYLGATIQANQDVSVSSVNGSILLIAGPSSILIGPSGIAISAPSITLNGVNWQHTHNDPVSGVTGPPQ